MTTPSSTANIISDNDYLIFPSHPRFDYQPDGLVGFGDWVCSGIWVGTGGGQDEEQEEVSSRRSVTCSLSDRMFTSLYLSLLTFGIDSSINLPLLPLPPTRNERRRSISLPPLRR